MTSAGVRKGGARRADPRQRRALREQANSEANPAAVPTKAPSWWHRGHPVFTPLAGFFAGLVFVLAVPTTFAALLRIFLSDDAAGSNYWLVLVTLLIPAVLVIVRPTRRFGKYMWLGIVLTAVVVISVIAVVLWLLTNGN